MLAYVKNLIVAALLWTGTCGFVLIFCYLQFGGGYDLLVEILPDVGRFLVFAAGFIGSLVIAAIPAGLGVLISRVTL